MVTYLDPGTLSFDATIERSDVPGSSSFVAVPFDVEQTFGTRGRVPVWADFDGETYRGSLVTYGGGRHLLLILTELQERLGKSPGDSVHVTVRLDTAHRTVELAMDVAEAFAHAGVLESYRAMSYSHQKEYNVWIEDAKKPDTRARRIGKAIDMIAEGARLK
jgi:hypothetical protein